jgi:ribosomal 30S subunit maturation factor RimM
MKFLAGVVVGVVLSVIGVDGAVRVLTNAVDSIKTYSQGLAK